MSKIQKKKSEDRKHRSEVKIEKQRTDARLKNLKSEVKNQEIERKSKSSIQTPKIRNQKSE